MTPTEILRNEHTLILRALDLLAIAADRLELGAVVPDASWSKLLAWLGVFADQNHHDKEECGLFPAMIEAGVPPGPGGPIGVMLEEHRRGRELVQAMAAGDPMRRAESARCYVDLLRAHIEKENGVLFPLAEAVIDDAAQRTLGRAFMAVASALGREAEPGYAEAVLEGLAASLAPSPAPAQR